MSYRQVYRAVYLAGQPRTVGIGVFVIIALNAFGGGTLGQAIPYGMAWVIASGACRFLLLMLPRPSAGGSSLPRETPLPPPALAVSITQAASPDACPDVPTMIARLPEDLRALMDKRPVS